MINSTNIILRPLKKADLILINSWRNNLENRILTQGFRGPVTMVVDACWLDEALNNQDNKDFYFGIETKETGKLTGIIQLNAIDYVSGVATCGILIGEAEERGKGIGIEAVRGLLFYAFFVLNLRKIITYIADFNESAFKVQRKVGKVHREGCLKAHYYYKGEYVDVYIQSFFKKDFECLKDEYSI